MIKWINSIRSIITLLVVFAWCFGFACGHVSVEAFGMTVGSIITFYFVGKKREEQQNEGGPK